MFHVNPLTRIHMKYQVLFSLKNNEKVYMNVICCSRGWCLKGQIFAYSESNLITVLMVVHVLLKSCFICHHRYEMK